jgi:hypothetical protein
MGSNTYGSNTDSYGVSSKAIKNEMTKSEANYEAVFRPRQQHHDRHRHRRQQQHLRQLHRHVRQWHHLRCRIWKQILRPLRRKGRQEGLYHG